jgi:hypothetical protein|tara:strand:- start:466 stop:996 length:531 start_codon:yes stop_codon:yes gene_type:complete
MENQRVYFYDQRQVDANAEVLNRLIKKGMKPKWYIVFHFKDGGGSNRLTHRRLDDQSVDADLEFVKDQLYTELYGRKWKKKTSRAMSYWSKEYGKSQVKPHFNLVMEELPYPYDDFRAVHVLFNRFLPLKCKCIWKDSAHIQPVDHEEVDNLSMYCSKESNQTNSTVNYLLTDFYK